MLGAGPGGYTAAFRAADLGKKVVLVDKRRPSAASASTSAASRRRRCCTSPRPSTRRRRWRARRQVRRAGDRPRGIRDWKDGVVKRLTGGLTGLARQRKVTVVPGQGRVHLAEHRCRSRLPRAHAHRALRARRSSRPAPSRSLPGFIPKRPAHLGLHRGAGTRRQSRSGCSSSAAASSASKWRPSITRSARRSPSIEMMDQLMPGADPTSSRPLAKRIARRYETSAQDEGDRRPGRARGARVTYEGRRRPEDRHLRRDAGRRSGAVQRQADRRGGRRASPSTSAASSRSTCRCAPTCRTSSPSATSSASRCWRTRRRTRARSRPRSAGGHKPRSTRAPSRRSPTPILKWPGPASPRRRPRRRRQVRQGGVPVGGERPRRSRSAATRA